MFAQSPPSLPDHHSLHINKLSAAKEIGVHAAWELRRIEVRFILSRALPFIHQPLHFSSECIIDDEQRESIHADLILDLRHGIEWVGMILFEREGAGDFDKPRPC